MPTLKTKVGRLFYESTGTGPAVLFWHSWLADSALWQAQVEELSRDHYVVLVDGPCHGRSEVVRRRFTLEECGDALTEIMDALDLDSAILAGSSWGGMTALRVALKTPERVRALALFNTTADAERGRNLAACWAFAELMTRFGTIPLVTSRITRLMFGETTLREKPHLVEWGLRRFHALDRAGFRAATNAIVLERESILHELPKIRIPTLVAVGAEDICLPPSRSRRIANAIPGAKLHVVPGAGHLLPIEAPEVVNQLLREFVTAVRAGTAEERPAARARAPAQ